MIADQREITRLLRKRDAFVGLAAVADQVAEVPDLVDADFADVGQDRLESREVGVHVREQRDSRGSPAARS